MEKGRREKSHETSPWPTRLGHGGDMDIPLDLKVEILKKLPAKSLVRFRSVSKQWSSIISSRRDFIESIVTRSLTQPLRDAHIFNHRFGECVLALSSTTSPLNTDKELLLLPLDVHQPVRGLICCWSSFRPYVVAIYNPTTKKAFYLPKLKGSADIYGSFLFGYDPLENQYKVVFLPMYRTGRKSQVFTLGDGTAKQWRTIQGYVEAHLTFRGVFCINGTIYYQEVITDINDTWKLMSFDVRSERFHQVEAPTPLTYHLSTVINYQGKLGIICCEKGVEIWVMETQRWSKIFFYEMEGFEHWCVSGVTRDGEIVLNKNFHNNLCVYYYDPKRNSMRYVDLEDYYTKAGGRDKYKHCTSVLTFPDHVENTMYLE